VSFSSAVTLTNIMAAESEDQEDGKGRSVDESTSHEAVAVDEDNVEGQDSDAEEGEEEEDEEPKLKYARMTGYLGQVYRNGDATSTFLVAGDKMVCLQRLREPRVQDANIP
jgi:hypothetical protein